MRFLSIKLNNYIGIYNGMGLYEIAIDFTKCMHNLIIIRGANGSGKSTLHNALTVLPDSNEQFIPRCHASKELVLFHAGTYYFVKCIHGVKSNGDRETTKVYFSKSTDGVNYLEMNASGNVSSYKEMLFEELELDANFIALSQLSSDDRGLAPKRPAERKKFVNSIIYSLETYNAIHKTLNKKSSMYKSMINSVSSKLGQLGDPKILETNYNDCTSRLLHETSNRDHLLESLGSIKAQIMSIDTDGSIQKSYDVVSKEISSLERELSEMNKSLKSYTIKAGISIGEDVVKSLDDIRQKRSDLQIENQILKSQVTSVLAERETEASQLIVKQQRMSSFDNPDRYQTLEDELVTLVTENESIISRFSSIGIVDLSSISKDEFILIVEALQSIKDNINLIKQEFYETDIDEAFQYVISGGDIGLVDAKRKFNELETEIYKIETEEVAVLSAQVSTLESLKLRPAECNIDHCNFIKDAIINQSLGVQDKYDTALAKLEDAKYILTAMELAIEKLETLSDCKNRILSVIREIYKYNSLLSKMPFYSNALSPQDFFLSVLKGNAGTDINMAIGLLDMSNMIDIYNNNRSIIIQLEAELKLAYGQKVMIDELISDIQRITSNVANLESKVVEINHNLSENDKFILELSSKESIYNTVIGMMESIVSREDDLLGYQNQLSEINNSMESIKVHLDNINTISKQLIDMDSSIAKLNREKERINRSLDLVKEYMEEFNKLSVDYDYIETIKYYSSPTTGIQLVFMEMYMGKIMALANELLSILFEGKFVLQPFIINESEFRIPCAGSGILNDDISSMSSAELSMISMIISFSLLFHSSTKFNILKLDEIDGPLDTTNRVMFVNVLDRIMQTMNVEQCIMISHNSELQSYNSDVILLRLPDDMENEYVTGNIIWRYK